MPRPPERRGRIVRKPEQYLELGRLQRIQLFESKISMTIKPLERKALRPEEIDKWRQTTTASLSNFKETMHLNEAQKNAIDKMIGILETNFTPKGLREIDRLTCFLKA